MLHAGLGDPHPNLSSSSASILFHHQNLPLLKSYTLPLNFHLQHTNILFNFYVFFDCLSPNRCVLSSYIVLLGTKPRALCVLVRAPPLGAVLSILNSAGQLKATTAGLCSVLLECVTVSVAWPALEFGPFFPGVPLSSPTQASLVTSSCSMAKGPWPWLEAVSELSCLTGVLLPSLFLLLRMSA